MTAAHCLPGRSFNTGTRYGACGSGNLKDVAPTDSPFFHGSSSKETSDKLDSASAEASSR